MTGQSAEHHCDGVWIDLDLVLDAAGHDRLDDAASAAASLGATGLIGDAATLERTRIPETLGTLVRGTPGEHAPWDLALAVEPSGLGEGAIWCKHTGGQLVLSEATVHSLGVDGLDRLGRAGAVAAIWCEDVDGGVLELARSSEDWTGFHDGLEFAAAYRAGAGALAGLIPILHPALAISLHRLRRDRVEQALDAERRLARWFETSLHPACRALGMEREEMSRAALEIGGWLRPGDARVGDGRLELRHELIQFAASLGLASVADLLSEAS